VKKRVMFVAIFILIMAVSGLILYTNIFPLAEPIELPKVNGVYNIEIHKENIIIEHKGEKEIQEILSYFSNAKPTRIMTAHDRPIIRDYYTVNFYSKEDRLYTSYIYNENSKWYIEQSYYGIYEVKDELIDFIS